MGNFRWVSSVWLNCSATFFSRRLGSDSTCVCELAGEADVCPGFVAPFAAVIRDREAMRPRCLVLEVSEQLQETSERET